MSARDGAHASAPRPDLRVGFIGLGQQGAPIARRIATAGFATTVWARRPESLEPLGDTSVHHAATPAALGEGVDVLGVCVLADADVDAVLRGAEGALGGMSDGGVVIVHSTTHPDTVRRLQADHPHLDVLDAPVSGGGRNAETGGLLVMVGGRSEVVDRCRPVLESYADPLVYLGPLGSAQEAKLLSNTLFAAQLALAADVFETARHRDLDLAGLATALRASSGRSYAADLVGALGFNLDVLASSSAGPLLAKDVGILADLLGPDSPRFLDVANHAVQHMSSPVEPGGDR